MTVIFSWKGDADFKRRGCWLMSKGHSLGKRENSGERAWKFVRTVFPTALSGVCVLSLFAMIDYDEIQFVSPDYWLVIGSFFLLALGYLTRSLFYQKSLNDRRIGTRQMFPVVAVHGFMLAVMPMGTGYLSYPYLLKKYFNVDTARSVSSVSAFVACKFAGLLILTAWSGYAIGLKYYTVDWKTAGLHLAVSIVVLAIAAIFYRCLVKYEGTNKGLIRLIGYARATKDATSYLYGWKVAPKLLVLTVSNIFVGAYYFCFAYSAFGATLSFVSACFMLGASTFAAILPVHGIGKLGSFEMLNAGLLVFIGFDKNQAIQLSFEVHLLLILQQVILGSIFYALLRKKKGRDRHRLG